VGRCAQHHFSIRFGTLDGTVGLELLQSLSVRIRASRLNQIYRRAVDVMERFRSVNTIDSPDRSTAFENDDVFGPRGLRPRQTEYKAGNKDCPKQSDRHRYPLATATGCTCHIRGCAFERPRTMKRRSLNVIARSKVPFGTARNVNSPR